jgi:hypothetical protein
MASIEFEDSPPAPTRSTRVREERGVGDAVERLYYAGQGLLVRRLELLVAEARELLSTGLITGVACALGLAGWFYAVAGVIDGLSKHAPREWVELGVGAAHIVVALGIAAFARARRRRTEAE